MPNGVMTHLQARLLKDLVNRAIHPIRCAESCRQKYMKGSRIGDLCAETGHFGWAMKVWRLTERLIADKDWDDWHDVWFDNDRVRIIDVISETECELLAKRRSDLWKALGFPEYAWYTDKWEALAGNTFGTYYTNLWLEQFDFDPVAWSEECETELSAYEESQETDQLFREAAAVPGVG